MTVLEGYGWSIVDCGVLNACDQNSVQMKKAEIAERIADRNGNLNELYEIGATEFPPLEQSYDYTEPTEAAVQWYGNPWNCFIGSAYSATRPHQIQNFNSIVRCVFGNPFRPVIANPAWLTSPVVGIAKAIYTERAFDRLPMLADALMDAGCEHSDVLDHCRSAGPHVRGCWVVDLIIVKE